MTAHATLPGVSDIDIHTTAGKLADLETRLDEAVHAGSRAGDREAARQGQADRPRARRPAARRGVVRRARRAGPAPVDQLRDGEEPPVRRRRRHRLRHRRRPPGVRLRAGLHRLRRQPRPGLRREDRQGHGPRDEDRLPGHRHQRLRRRPHPGRRRLARPVRRDLPPQRARVRRHPADLADHGAVRRRRRLLPRDHRLHRDGRQDLAHVHHRPRRDQDRHRRGRLDGGARRRAHPQHQERATRTTSAPTRTTRSTTSRRCSPTCRRTTSRTRRRTPRTSRPRARPTTTARSTP